MQGSILKTCHEIPLEKMTTLASTTADETIDEMTKVINADKESDNDLENDQLTAKHGNFME